MQGNVGSGALMCSSAVGVLRGCRSFSNGGYGYGAQAQAMLTVSYSSADGNGKGRKGLIPKFMSGKGCAALEGGRVVMERVEVDGAVRSGTLT